MLDHYNKYGRKQMKEIKEEVKDTILKKCPKCGAKKVKNEEGKTWPAVVFHRMDRDYSIGPTAPEGMLRQSCLRCNSTWLCKALDNKDNNFNGFQVSLRTMRTIDIFFGLDLGLSIPFIWRMYDSLGNLWR